MITIIIKSLLLWIVGWALLNLVESAQKLVVNEKYDIGLKELGKLVLYAIQISIVLPESIWNNERIVYAAVFILLVYIVVIFIKLKFLDNSNSFFNKYCLIKDVIHTYNNPLSYINAGAKLKYLNEYIRLTTHISVVIICIALLGFIFFTTTNAPLSQNRVFTLYLIFIMIPILVNGTVLVNRIRDYFGHEAFIKPVLDYLFLDVVKKFSSLIALIYVVPLGYYKYSLFVIFILTVLFVLIAFTSYYSDRKNISNRERQDEDYIISAIQENINELTVENFDETKDSLLKEFKDKRSYLYDHEKYARFFLMKLSGLDFEKKITAENKDAKFESNIRRVVYESVLNEKENILNRDIILKQYRLIPPLKFFANLDFLILKIEEKGFDDFKQFFNENIFDRIRRKHAVVNPIKNHTDNKIMEETLFYIQRANTEKAIKILLNSKYNNEVLVNQFSSRYENLKVKDMANVIEDHKRTIIINKLNYDIIRYIKEKIE